LADAVVRDQKRRFLAVFVAFSGRKHRLNQP
jgi:hypothetical protein